MIDIYNDLSQLNKDVYIQGDAPEKLPNEFYVFSEDYTSDNLNADNKALEHVYEFTLYFFTKNVNNVYTGLNEAITTLKRKGYIISGTGYHFSSSNGYFSRAVDIKKIDYL